MESASTTAPPQSAQSGTQPGVGSSPGEFDVSKGSALSEPEAVMDELELQCASLHNAWGSDPADDKFAAGDVVFWPESGRACEVKGLDADKVATAVVMRDSSITFAAAADLYKLSRPMQASLRRAKRNLDAHQRTADPPVELPSVTVVEAKTRQPSSNSSSARADRSLKDRWRTDEPDKESPQDLVVAMVSPPKALPPGLPPGFPQIELVKKWTGREDTPPSDEATIPLAAP